MSLHYKEEGFDEKLIQFLDNIKISVVKHKNKNSKDISKELEDITKDAILDKLNLDSSAIYNGIQDIEKRSKGIVNNVGLKERERQTDIAKEHMLVIDDLKKIKNDYCFSFTTKKDVSDFFIKHPFGEQRWPEFVIHHNGKFLPIEIKSSTDKKIMWNSGLPKIGCLYIYFYTNDKVNDSDNRVTVFFGEDLITKDAYKKLKEKHQVIKSINDENNEELCGFTYKVRQSFYHKVQVYNHPKSEKWFLKAKKRLSVFGGADNDKLKKLENDVQVEKNHIKNKRITKSKNKM